MKRKKNTRVKLRATAKLPEAWQDQPKDVIGYQISRFLVNMEEHYAELVSKARADLAEANGDSSSAQERIRWFTDDMAVLRGLLKSLKVKVKTRRVKKNAKRTDGNVAEQSLSRPTEADGHQAFLEKIQELP